MNTFLSFRLVYNNQIYVYVEDNTSTIVIYLIINAIIFLVFVLLSILKKVLFNYFMLGFSSLSLSLSFLMMMMKYDEKARSEGNKIAIKD